MQERNPQGTEPKDVPPSIGSTTSGMGSPTRPPIHDAMPPATSGTATGSGSQMGSESERNMARMREAWRSGSPNEVREATRNLVEKGVAAVAGALRGFADAAQREKMPDEARKAVHQAGETAKAATSEAQNQASQVGQKAKDLSTEVRRQASDMKKEAKSMRDDMKSESTTGSRHVDRTGLE